MPEWNVCNQRGSEHYDLKLRVRWERVWQNYFSSLIDKIRTDWSLARASMWIKANRKKYDRRHQRYPSDLNNEEWQLLETMLPVAKGVGRPRTHTPREIVNGIRYVQKYGIPWDAMPKDLPPFNICYDFWRLLTDKHHIEQINHLLVMADREKAGREASPTPQLDFPHFWMRVRS